MSRQYTYSCATSSIDLAACTWRFDAFQPTLTAVIPDGCHDLIVVEGRMGDARAFISELGEATYKVSADAGSRFCGVRLKPGVTVDRQALFGFLACNAPQDLLIGDRFVEFCKASPALSEALGGLADTKTVIEVAKDLGVSVRTLQRVVVNGSGKPPTFWRALARARRSAKLLPRFYRLADAAAVCGFSDQAHLSREMMRWFGQTPTALKQDHALLAQLKEPGYATGFTGEQISTRNPSGSDT